MSPPASLIPAQWMCTFWYLQNGRARLDLESMQCHFRARVHHDARQHAFIQASRERDKLLTARA
eukprot:5336410-Prymnesium_polylepis.1